MRTLSAIELGAALDGITHRRHFLCTTEQTTDVTSGDSDGQTEESGTPKLPLGNKPRTLTKDDEAQITQATIRRKAAQRGRRVFDERLL